MCKLNLNRFILLLVFPAILLTSCGKNPHKTPSLSEHLYQDTIGFEFSAFYLRTPEVAPEVLLQRCIEADSSRLYQYLQDQDSARLPSLMVCKVNNISRNYPPPTPAVLKDNGFGMSPDQMASLQKAADVLIMDFNTDRKHLWDAYRKALEYLYAITVNQDAIIYDQKVKACYTPEAWKSMRIDTWQTPVPDLRDHFIIRSQTDGQACRTVTFGMGKFGLPDVVLDKLPCSNQRQFCSLISLICQSMAERGRLMRGDSLSLDINSVQNEKFRKSLATSPDNNASGKAIVQLRMMKRLDSDPLNRLVGLKCPKDAQAYPDELITSIFGSKVSQGAASPPSN